MGDSNTWLLGTQGAGYWRTTDAGTTWKQVSTTEMQHREIATYVSKSGVLYVAPSAILRSTDNGQTFTLVDPNRKTATTRSSATARTLHAARRSTGGNTIGDQPYLTSLESDGITWTAYNAQKFADGPYRMAFDLDQPHRVLGKLECGRLGAESQVRAHDTRNRGCNVAPLFQVPRSATR